MSMITDFFQNLLAGFAWIIIFSLVVWMGGLVVLLIMELFSPNELFIKEYLWKVWKMFRTIFEWSSYGGIIAGLVMTQTTDEVYSNVMISLAAVILSVFHLSWRKQSKPIRDVT
ncbi:hypothetical protein SAMN04487866_10890 [Thermoactinomyces sp. DSM 45891]|uniref:hypothetical protein n=1 Tax=Thermoactinomyces sp. DSM 45891 TaxID=1761907 RepID=UPI000922E2B6|nr:hypothetical protein [Thermoactinomyces sp. DSM 45891]SFX45946.1 hypothetical protein SAMN04487866_10890 [Thermoactinomyces sp. DSM 45891]